MTNRHSDFDYSSDVKQKYVEVEKQVLEIKQK